MVIISNEERDTVSLAKNKVAELGLGVSDNVFLLCHALESTKNLDGIYLECGVYKGSTILTANEYCKIRGIEKEFLGVDSFKGFPKNQTTNHNDLPEAFETLFSSKKITKEHYLASKQRLSVIENLAHLSSEYFNDPGQIIFEQAKKRNIKLIEGTFSEALPKINKKIAVFHIDCDLYAPYLECLQLQFKNVISGGYIVLDEYYSLKYPGARIAVNQFLEGIDQAQYSLECFMTGEFERWCIKKQ
jgi:hypothetical protein